MDYSYNAQYGADTSDTKQSQSINLSTPEIHNIHCKCNAYLHLFYEVHFPGRPTVDDGQSVSLTLDGCGDT